jgi:FkbM family methyltransferase
VPHPCHLTRVKIDNQYLKTCQMELALNPNAKFTKWVVSMGLITEPFVLIDVGVQGGEHVRWRALDDYLIVHGFDPIEEVIQELAEANKGHSNRYYHCMALGNADSEQKFYFNPVNPTASSMFVPGTGRFGVEAAEQPRMVPIRRLDSLLAEGVIPVADYIKIDVEGFEKDVLLGAHELLSAGVLGLQTETNFGVSPSYPKSHFGTLAETALENHLVVFDLVFNRIPRASFQQALISEGLQPITEQDAVGRPSTVDVLFARDLIGEVDHPEHYQTPCRPVSVNQLIKSIIICELHALNDVALDTVERFAERLGAQLDVDRAVRLLADSDCVTNEYQKQLRVQRRQLRAYEQQLRAQRRAFEQSTSWRITAPLRWTRLLLFGAPRQQPHIDD